MHIRDKHTEFYFPDDTGEFPWDKPSWSDEKLGKTEQLDSSLGSAHKHFIEHSPLIMFPYIDRGLKNNPRIRLLNGIPDIHSDADDIPFCTINDLLIAKTLRGVKILSMSYHVSFRRSTAEIFKKEGEYVEVLDPKSISIVRATLNVDNVGMVGVKLYYNGNRLLFSIFE